MQQNLTRLVVAKEDSNQVCACPLAISCKSDCVVVSLLNRTMQERVSCNCCYKLKHLVGDKNKVANNFYLIY